MTTATPDTSSGAGIVEWLRSVPADELPTIAVVFDTRVLAARTATGRALYGAGASMAQAVADGTDPSSAAQDWDHAMAAASEGSMVERAGSETAALAAQFLHAVDDDEEGRR